MEIRFFKKSERQLLLDSIDRLWRHNHIYVRKPEVLEHLVLNTPYREEYAGKDNYSFVGIWDDDGNVVGLQGIIPQRFNIFGKEYLSTTGTVWFVDKSAKKKNHKSINGLRMWKASPKNVEVMASCGFGLSDISYQINEANGGYMTKDFSRWIAIANKEAVLKNLLPESTNPMILPELRSIEYGGNLKVNVDGLNKDKWDDYYFHVFAPVTIGTQRDYRFLKWRYMESPVLKYTIVTILNDKGKYLGLAIFRREPILDGKFALGRIVEFISLSAEASVVLADAVVKTFPDVIAWDFYCLSSITSYGLETVGFRRIPEWMDCVMIPTRFQPIDYTHLRLNGYVYVDENLRYYIDQMTEIPWYITRGDSDQDRAN